tara:strand:+ start:588 stop:1964 length:1377 start_codon:yes stop_codon:yes gene_type:complete
MNKKGQLFGFGRRKRNSRRLEARNRRIRLRERNLRVQRGQKLKPRRQTQRRKTLGQRFDEFSPSRNLFQGISGKNLDTGGRLSGKERLGKLGTGALNLATVLPLPVGKAIKASRTAAALGKGKAPAFIKGLGANALRSADEIAQAEAALAKTAAVTGVGAGVNAIRAATSGTVKKTVAQTATKVGQTTTRSGTPLRFVQNSKTQAETQSWLQRLFTATSVTERRNLLTGEVSITQKVARSSLSNSLKVSATSAANIVAMIGSYPFAKFLHEEALQTLDLGVFAAVKSGSVEGANLAIAEQKDLLNPDVWDKILANIPYVNVLEAVRRFYEAARIKVQINEMVVQDLQKEAEGKSKEEIFQDNRAQIVQEQIDQVERFAESRRIDRQLEKDAREEGREEDAEFWAEERKKKFKEELEHQKQLAALWTEFAKTKADIQRSAFVERTGRQARSTLSFGLLR